MLLGDTGPMFALGRFIEAHVRNRNRNYLRRGRHQCRCKQNLNLWPQTRMHSVYSLHQYADAPPSSLLVLSVTSVVPMAHGRDTPLIFIANWSPAFIQDNLYCFRSPLVGYLSAPWFCNWFGSRRGWKMTKDAARKLRNDVMKSVTRMVVSILPTIESFTWRWLSARRNIRGEQGWRMWHAKLQQQERRQILFVNGELFHME